MLPEAVSIPTVVLSRSLAIFRLIIWALVTVVTVPLQLLFMALRLKWADQFPHVYHRVCCKIFGVQIVTHGRPSKTAPTFFVSNHVSYLDILLLGATVPARFVAKAEIAKWPVFGLLAKLQRTVFIERRPSLAKNQNAHLKGLLENGTNLILFPEGTTGDGTFVLPFKSSLFAVLEQANHATVQPVSISYTHVDGVAAGRHLRPLITWYGDMDMASHMPKLLGLGRITAQVTFHEPIQIPADFDRKALAQQCGTVVALGVDALNYGRSIKPLKIAVK